jgi:dihydrofolate synthase/folylpolyglutamate synthase
MGLERVSQVAARLDVLKPAPFVFTVAGTNGKGTTCRTLESVLMAAGYKVGVYSSPHLVRYTERVRVQNESCRSRRIRRRSRKLKPRAVRPH